MYLLAVAAGMVAAALATNFVKPVTSAEQPADEPPPKRGFEVVSQ